MPTPVGAGQMLPQPLGKVYAATGSSHFLKSKSGDGKLVTLDDGSVWEVDLLDQLKSGLWLPGSSITVTECSSGYILTNDYNSEKVHAKLQD